MSYFNVKLIFSNCVSAPRLASRAIEGLNRLGRAAEPSLCRTSTAGDGSKAQLSSFLRDPSTVEMPGLEKGLLTRGDATSGKAATIGRVVVNAQLEKKRN